MYLYLKLIEQQIFNYKNFEMYKLVITCMRDESFKYRDQALIASKNLEAITNHVEPKDIMKINQMIQSEDDLIICFNLKDLSKEQLLKHQMTQ